MHRRISRSIKDIVGRALFGLGLHRHLYGDRAIVVAFHTIGETGKENSIQVTPAQFRRYCAFFKRYFDVVSLKTLLEDIRSGRNVGGKLVITFDDGYRDNHTYAAVELERVGLPATFFVSTDFIGSDLTPWWDAESGVKSEWMTWKEVIDLDQRGFDIGAHTRTHPNLASSSEEAAREEIFGSKRILESKLGHEVAHFAYPYGKEADINDLSRGLVTEAGFSCCASCFGGVTSSNSDPMYLSRIPINDWYGSPFQFGLEAMRSLRTSAGEYGEEKEEIFETLMVSYHLYPDAAVGARRPSEIMRSLQKEGHNVEAISASLSKRTPIDTSLASHLDGLKVMRVPQPASIVDWIWRNLKLAFRALRRTSNDEIRSEEANDVSMAMSPRSETLFETLRRNYVALDGLFNSKKQWAMLAIIRVVFRRFRKRYTLVISSGPPSAAHVVGYFAATLHGADLVMDFRDPWVGNTHNTWRNSSRFRERLESIAESRCVRKADLIVVTTPGIQRMLTDRYASQCDKIRVIYNGYDGVAKPPSAEVLNRLDMLYAGTLYLNRDPFPLLKAIKHLVERQGVDRSKVSMTFVGECDAWRGRSLTKWLQSNRLDDVVTIKNRVSGPELDKMIENCSVLVNLAQGQPDQIPAKTFEYMASGKHLIVMTERNSDTAKIVTSTNYGVILDSANPEETLNSLVELYRLVMESSSRVDRMVDVAQFSRERQNSLFVREIQDIVASNQD